MLGSISIFNKRPFVQAATMLAVFLITSIASIPMIHAADGTAPDKTLIPEEEDHSSTPFTEYGEFNEEEEEAADTRFLQYGRFFGVSVGLGYEGVTGNRGKLWRGGFPLIDFKVHYWFDFNLAMDLGLFFVTHNYEFTDPTSLSKTQVEVRMFHVGLDIKYYFETQNLSSAMSFSNPYVLLGIGNYTKRQQSPDLGISPSDYAFSIAGGAGLEFPIKPKKTYFSLEGKFYRASFADTTTSLFSGTRGLSDLSGLFYTITGSLLFTW